MFIKPIVKYKKPTGESYSIYQLCESYRFDGRICHRVIVGLGKLEILKGDKTRIKAVGRRIEELLANGASQLSLFDEDIEVEELARLYYAKILDKNSFDTGDRTRELELVDLCSVKNKNIRELGAEWLCLQAFNQLNIAGFLKEKKWTDEKIALAQIHIITRAIYPASELKSLSYIKENSAICELAGYQQDKVTKDKLYNLANDLFQIKDDLENFLSQRTNELFDIEDKIILYDLTNTYFEGRMAESELAKFGKSKERRNDAPLVVLALVVNPEGFLKYSHIFEGNIRDNKTLSKVIETLGTRTSASGRRAVVVMDAGIVTEENLQFLKDEGYQYICVSKSPLKDSEIDIQSDLIQTTDSRKRTIELKLLNTDSKDSDRYLLVKSQARALTAQSINAQLTLRFEQGLSNIRKGIERKGGVKRLDIVHQRIGRLLERYPSIHKYYQISVDDNGKGVATCLNYNKLTDTPKLKNSGVYFLRTSLNEKDEKNLWTIYNTIREVEYTFRVLKTDLDLRPIYHKTDKAVKAHLHLGILAYWLVATLRYQLKQKDIHSNWKEIIRIMNTQKCITTTVNNGMGKHISIRQCSEPTKMVEEIYNKLNYKHKPFSRKKSVVVPS